MNKNQTDTGTNGRGDNKHNEFPLYKQNTEGVSGFDFKNIYSGSAFQQKAKGQEIYGVLKSTGEVEGTLSKPSSEIAGIIASAIDLIQEVIELYDDEIEMENKFTFYEDKIKSLWELRENANRNFVEILVLLDVVNKNSHYQSYSKAQFISIKEVLEIIRNINITIEKAKECRKLLLKSGIDLFAPIRNWDDYTIEIKKNKNG